MLSGLEWAIRNSAGRRHPPPPTPHCGVPAACPVHPRPPGLGALRAKTAPRPGASAARAASKWYRSPLRPPLFRPCRRRPFRHPAPPRDPGPPSTPRRLATGDFYYAAGLLHSDHVGRDPGSRCAAENHRRHPLRTPLFTQPEPVVESECAHTCDATLTPRPIGAQADKAIDLTRFAGVHCAGGPQGRADARGHTGGASAGGGEVYVRGVAAVRSLPITVNPWPRPRRCASN